MTGCLESALKTLCCHRMGDSFKAQLSILKKAAYPDLLVVSIAERLIMKVEGHAKHAVDSSSSGKLTILLYHRRISPNINKVGSRFGVRLVFSSPYKLESLCFATGEKRRACTIKRARVFSSGCVGVVHKILFYYGRIHIGPTGRCINERMREHAISLGGALSGHLVVYCNMYKCKTVWNNLFIVGRFKDRGARAIQGASLIHCSCELCMSAP